MTGQLTLNSSSGEKGKEESEYLFQKNVTDKQADKKLSQAIVSSSGLRLNIFDPWFTHNVLALL